jgi:hypothetical protein
VNNESTVAQNVTPEQRAALLEQQIREYRRDELDRWAECFAENHRYYASLEAIQQTVSWRVTAPLRAFRRHQLDK